MKQFKYHVRFTTPAFLGNAEQSGQWRTPPIKALLRQWWRVVWAADHGFPADVNAMRQEEGRLFGVASDGDGDSRRSLVRIRLDRWEEGALTKTTWGRQELDKSREGVHHPEVGNIGPKLYLGYGPLVVEKVVEKVEQRGQKPQYATVLKNNAAIQAGEAATLSIAFPEMHAPRLERALWLMDRYGTLGGRSRNGWGSFSLRPLPSGEGRGEGKPLAGSTPLRFWQDCLNLDWPHAIGQDERGALIWQTQPFDDWKALMRRLAEIKIGLRRLFLFPNERPDGEVHDRHWLSYPVTKHNVREWDRNKLRLPNCLRFKVRATPEGKLVGVIFHVPHLPPAAFRPNRQDIETVWTQVYRFLAPAQSLTRIPE